MRLLVIGANGQLGRAVRAACDPQHHLTAWGHADADIAHPAVMDAIVALRPDVVINCAAWTNVDGAEQNPDAAFAANALGAHHVACGCAAAGASLVHVSTNEVFAGTPGRIYYEYEQVAPTSVYARSKAAGEAAARQALAQLYVVRVAWLFGPGGNNFPGKIMAAADRHGALKVVDDECGNPTYAPDAAAAIFALIAHGRFGTYHLVNEGYASRFTFAEEVLRATGRGHVPLTPIKLTDWPRPAPPPPHAVLANQAGAALGITLRPWQEAVRDFAQHALEKQGT